MWLTWMVRLDWLEYILHWQRSIHCWIRYIIVATHASHLLSQTDSRQSVTTQSVLDVKETNLVPADCSSFGKRRSYSFICHSLSLSFRLWLWVSESEWRNVLYHRTDEYTSRVTDTANLKSKHSSQSLHCAFYRLISSLCFAVTTTIWCFKWNAAFALAIDLLACSFLSSSDKRQRQRRWSHTHVHNQHLSLSRFVFRFVIDVLSVLAQRTRQYCNQMLFKCYYMMPWLPYNVFSLLLRAPRRFYIIQ